MSDRPSPRSIAVSLLEAWYAHQDLPTHQIHERSDGDGAGLVMEVVYGVLRQQRFIDYVLAGCMKKPPEAPVLALLRAAVYQILFLNPTDRFAVVHASVDLARQQGNEWVCGFVNAVLRKVCREADLFLSRRASLPLGTRTSHPDGLIKRWRRVWPEKEIEALCAWNNERPGLTLRVIDPDDLPGLQSALAQMGVASEPHPFRPADFLLLLTRTDVATLPGYREGRFTVQDPSTTCAVALAGLAPGMTVLDACAAPGGKCGLLAQAVQPGGLCVAMDASASRCRRLADTLERLGLASKVPLVVADATSTDLAHTLAARDLPGQYDCVLIDAPCSNTGVFRRRVEARWRFSENNLRGLGQLQARLIQALAPRVKPGGCLVYSTCSLEPEENRGQVDRWLHANRGWLLEADRAVFPPRDGVDGAYAARLRFQG